VALLAALLAGLALGARSESEAALNLYSQTRARYAADAGVARAIEALREGDPVRRWVPDGRTYQFEFDGARVQVRIDDVSGQVDLNAATPQVLTNLFRAAGADNAQAQALSDAVQDWRDSDDLPHAHGAEADTYKQAGLTWQPRNGPFRSSDELARVYGMTNALYRKLAEAVTVYSGRNFPDPQYAGPLTLAASRDGDLDAATRAVEARRAHPQQTANGVLAQIQSGIQSEALVAGAGGVTQEIRSVATLPDGTRSGQDVTVRLTVMTGSLRPYAVLGWRGFSENEEVGANSR
jgi:general secretion pathway protein K